jgi:hypothetical protein
VYFIKSAITIVDCREYKILLLDYYLEELYKQGGLTFSSKEDNILTEFKKLQLAGFELIFVITEM